MFIFLYKGFALIQGSNDRNELEGGLYYKGLFGKALRLSSKCLFN
jgi:hypothetical protein